MIIALDYDDTFTKDEYLWRDFIKTAKARGHTVKFVTFRHEKSIESNHDILHSSRILEVEIVFCNFQQKASKFVADIWIDDSPQFIVQEHIFRDHINNYRKFQLHSPVTKKFNPAERGCLYCNRLAEVSISTALEDKWYCTRCYDEL